MEVIQVQIIGALFHKFQVAAGEGGGHDGQLQAVVAGLAAELGHVGVVIHQLIGVQVEAGVSGPLGGVVELGDGGVGLLKALLAVAVAGDVGQALGAVDVGEFGLVLDDQLLGQMGGAAEENVGKGLVVLNKEGLVTGLALLLTVADMLAEGVVDLADGLDAALDQSVAHGIGVSPLDAQAIGVDLGQIGGGDGLGQPGDGGVQLVGAQLKVGVLKDEVHGAVGIAVGGGKAQLGHQVDRAVAVGSGDAEVVDTKRYLFL